MKLTVSAPPHIHKNISINRIMFTVLLALVPSFCWAIYLFGFRVLWLVIISCISAITTEALAQIILKRKLSICDGSALLTGLLLSFTLPVKSPLWVPAVGSLFAILVVKQAFGGLGHNLINPALAGRAFLMAVWPEIMMERWSPPSIGSISGINAITSATPLNVLKTYSSNPMVVNQLNSPEVLINLFFGFRGGCLGETSTLLLLLGGLFLIIIKYIDWCIPLSYIGSVGILMQILYLLGIIKVTGLFHILTGGLFLGAFFMATDYVTSPITHKGKCLFGIGCGIITVLIRLFGVFPEGVCYSILLMNCFVPLIDRSIKPRKLCENR